MLVSDFLLQRLVRFREHTIERGPKDRDRPSAARDGFAVRDRIDALGQAAHGDDALGNECLDELACGTLAIGGWVPGSDDGHSRMTLQERHVAVRPERRWCKPLLYGVERTEQLRCRRAAHARNISEGDRMRTPRHRDALAHA